MPQKKTIVWKLQILKPTVYQGVDVWPGTIVSCISRPLAIELTRLVNQKFRVVPGDTKMTTVNRARFFSSLAKFEKNAKAVKEFGPGIDGYRELLKSGIQDADEELVPDASIVVGVEASNFDTAGRDVDTTIELMDSVDDFGTEDVDDNSAPE